MESSNNVVENKAYQRPGKVVDAACRRHGTKTSEENGDVDESPERKRETSGKEVERNWKEEADREEPEKSVVPEGDSSEHIKSWEAENLTFDQH